MHTIHLLAAGNPFASLFGTIGGLVASLVAGLLGMVVGFATLVVIWNLIKAMAKNPSIEKLLGIVGVGLLAAVLAGATPALLAASYQWGKDLGSGTPADLTAQAGQ